MGPKATGVVILAAGRSSRMQVLKALLPFNDSNFLNSLLMTYLGWGCKEVVVVINEYLGQNYSIPGGLRERVRIVKNDHLEFERFYSVKLGLQNITKTDYCFVQNVDNPFITENILERIYQERNPDQWISPRFKNQGGHPVLLNRGVINSIVNYPENDANLKEILESLPCKKIEMTDDRILININEQSDFDKYKEIYTN